MKGDQGDISRGEKLFQRVSQGDKFKKEIGKITKEFEKEIGEFSYSPFKPLLDTQEQSDKFRKEVDGILRRSGFPINTWWRRRLITFTLTGDKKDFLPPLQDFETPFIELVNHHVERDGSYNDLRFYEGIAQSDVKEFVARNWKYMEPSYRKGTTQKIRGQSKKDIEILDEANRLMKLSRQELGIKKGMTTTKEIVVTGKLYEKFKRKITDDALKARRQRARKKQR